VAMENKEFREAMHYINILVHNCGDAINFIAKKIEIFIQ